MQKDVHYILLCLYRLEFAVLKDKAVGMFDGFCAGIFVRALYGERTYELAYIAECGKTVLNRNKVVQPEIVACFESKRYSLTFFHGERLFCEVLVYRKLFSAESVNVVGTYASARRAV